MKLFESYFFPRNIRKARKIKHQPDKFSFFSSAVLPKELRDYVCVAGSFSKTYAMTGWRIGYTIAPEEWTKEMVKLQSHSATHPTSFVQYACARAMERRAESMSAVSKMLAEYQQRRDCQRRAYHQG